MTNVTHAQLWTLLSAKPVGKPDLWEPSYVFARPAEVPRVGTAARPATAATRKANAWEETDVSYLLEDEELAILAFEVLFYGERNVRKALELASEAVRSNAETRKRNTWSLWRVNAGMACSALGLFRDAETHFKIVLSVSGNIDASRELARVFVAQDEISKALETLGSAAQVFPKDPRLLALIAKLRNSKGAFMDVLRLDPSSKEALSALGTLHFEENEPEIALKYFQRILELHGPSADLWNNIALAAVYSNQTDVGLPAFEQAIAASEGIDKKKSDIWFNVAGFAILEAELEFAKVALRLAITLNPTNAAAHVNLGLLFLHEENFVDARESLATAISIDTGFFEAQFNAALIDFRLVRMDTALAHVNAALLLSPDHAETILLRSLIKAELSK